MRVRDWMTPDPVVTTPGVGAVQAGHVMTAQGVRHLPVVEARRVVGMISDRDVRGALPGATVAKVMSTPPQVIREDEAVQAAARLMLSRQISALPVVTANGDLVGMITTTDCLLASLSQPDSVEAETA